MQFFLSMCTSTIWHMSYWIQKWSWNKNFIVSRAKQNQKVFSRQNCTTNIRVKCDAVTGSFPNFGSDAKRRTYITHNVAVWQTEKYHRLWWLVSVVGWKDTQKPYCIDQHDILSAVASLNTHNNFLNRRLGEYIWCDTADDFQMNGFWYRSCWSKFSILFSLRFCIKFSLSLSNNCLFARKDHQYNTDPCAFTYWIKNELCARFIVFVCKLVEWSDFILR